MSASLVLRQPWAIEPAALEELAVRYAAQLSASSLERPAAAPAPRPRGEVAIAIIPVHGVLMRHVGFLDALFGASSTELVGQELRAAAADPGVKAIVLDVDSPGGMVDGTQELARLVHEVGAVKQVAAVANGAMCSAAYWIASAADSVWVSSDTVPVGSIGVLAKHFDISSRERMLGIKTSEIFAGRYKVLGSQHAALSDEGREDLQARVDHLYSLFVNDVARFRATPASTVLSRMADGRVFLGRQAIAAGLADGAATVEEIAGRLAAGTLPRRRTAAAADLGGEAAAMPSLQTFEGRCKTKWRQDVALQNEFGGNFAAYVAWERVVSAGRVHGRRSDG